MKILRTLKVVHAYQLHTINSPSCSNKSKNYLKKKKYMKKGGGEEKKRMHDLERE